MSQPSPSDVHVDQPLTNISLAYVQDQTAYVATRVAPMVPVRKQTDKYFIFDKNAWFRDEVQLRPPGTESSGSGYTVSNTTYSCDVWAHHKKIDNQTRRNSDNPLDPDRNATTWLTQLMLIRMERQFVTDLFTTSVWGTDVTGGTNFTQWSDQASSTPIEDVEKGKFTVLQNTGFMPNKLVLGANVWKHLRNHPDLVARLGDNATRIVTPQMAAQLFEVEEVLISRAAYATNKENGTAAYSFAAGNHALLLHTPNSPGLEVPSAAYSFMWNELNGVTNTPYTMSKWYEQKVKSDIVEIESAFDFKATGTDLGYFFSTAVAS